MKTKGDPLYQIGQYGKHGKIEKLAEARDQDEAARTIRNILADGLSTASRVKVWSEVPVLINTRWDIEFL